MVFVMGEELSLREKYKMFSGKKIFIMCMAFLSDVFTGKTTLMNKKIAAVTLSMLLLVSIIGITPVNAADSSLYEPIQITGFNVDIIPEGSGTVGSQTDCGLDATGITYCTDTFASTHSIYTGNNLPDNGRVVNSISGSTYEGATYQLNPYNDKNVLLLFSQTAYDRYTGTLTNPRDFTDIFSGANTSGRLTLETPGAYEKLLFLATSGDGQSDFNVTVNFTDGSSTAPISFTVYDWCVGTSPYTSVQGLNEVLQNGTSRAANAKLFDCYIDISAHKTKLVESVDFSLTSTGNGLAAIFALSGKAPEDAPNEPTTPASTEIVATSTSFTAKWNAVTDATSYALDVSTDPNFGSFVNNYNNLEVGNVTEYKVDQNIVEGTTYYYRVRAIKGGSSSFSSDVVQVSTPNSAADPAKNSVTANPATITFGDSSTITAIGDKQAATEADSGETKYIPTIWSCTDGSSGFFNVDGNGDYKITYTPTSSGTKTITATYQLYTSDGSGWNINAGSIDTKTVDVVVNTKQLTTPSNLAWDSASFTKATWDAVDNATNYSVQLFKNGSPVSTYITNNAYYDFSGDITTDGTYTFKVTANGTGNYATSLQSAASSGQDVCSITWNEQGGSGAAGGSSLLPAGNLITIPTTSPTKAGHSFGGWFTQADGYGTQITNASTAPSGTVEYYAYWSADALISSVSISGTALYGEELTADISNITNNTGTLSFRWQRNGGDISGATSQTYTIIAEDVGQSVAVVVTSDVQTGSLTSTAVTPQYGEFTITFAPNGGTGEASDDQYPFVSFELHNGSGFTRDNYVIDGWTIEGTDYELGGLYSMPTYDVTANAIWAKDTDYDGVSDDDEVSAGTNPNDPQDRPQKGTITVTVYQQDGSPAAGMTCVLNSAPVVVTTDADGNAVFTDVDLAPHTLTLRNGTVQLGTYSLNFTEGSSNSTNIADNASTDSDGSVNTTVASNFLSLNLKIQLNESNFWELGEALYTQSAINAGYQRVENPQTGDYRTYFNELWIWMISAAVLLGACAMTFFAVKKKTVEYI